jgi:hypothetical protein
MSEYQYYEFQAIDRPLTNQQMAELRAITSRARITPTSLTNVYHFGDFKGDPVELLMTHFDAHLYTANWGTHTLMFGFPRATVDLEQLNPYRVEAETEYETGLMVMERGQRVIVTFASHREEYGEEVDEDEDEPASSLSPMIPLRSDVVNGDLRALYLGWLAGAAASFDASVVTDDELDDDEVARAEFENVDLFEPPVPPGLGELTGPLRKLAGFLRLDRALIDVAAERSTPLKETRLPERKIRAWLAALPSREKDEILFRLVKGEARLGAELVRRLRADLAPPADAAPAGERRTIGDLVRAGRERAAEQARRVHERQGRDRARHPDATEG